MRTKALFISVPLILAILPWLLGRANVSGTWSLTVESQEGTATPSVKFVQSGEKLSGVYRGRMGESKLEGTLQGNAIQFTVTLRLQDQSFVTSYSGTVDGDTMSGRVQFEDGAAGKWSGKRAE